MRIGSESGAERPRGHLVISLFRDSEDGFTTVAVALALLLSLTLVFSAASAGWVSARSSEVQRVADAAAMAGQNAVAAFSTIAQVVDACVLSLGLTGLIAYGAGFVASCVPGLSAVGIKMCTVGNDVLKMRRQFSKTAAEGLEKLEGTLPALVVANSASCVAANSGEGLEYVGCALPFPVTSGSDFSAFATDVDDSSFTELSEQMSESSKKAEEAKERAEEALKKGWMADCGSEPYCLRERAASLAGLSLAENPNYPSADLWTFAAALLRARHYYEARHDAERVEGTTAEELTNAACRKAFYAYALEQVRAGSYTESSEGTVTANLPSLPRNADETRETELYTDVRWPCTSEDGVRTLHSSEQCPGAAGSPDGTATLAQLDAGEASTCDDCEMDVGELGRVASASTSINNGFEYHWRIIVEASEEYEAARNEWVEAEAGTKDLAQQGAESFSQAFEHLTVSRPTLRPPGAWGCVAVVMRGEGSVVPTELTEAFLSSSELPAGVAVSAAVLAPDESTEQNNVLSSFFDSLSADDSLIGGAVDGVLELWGGLLVGYGSSYETVAEAGGGFLDGIDGVLGGSVGSWLKEQIKGIMTGLGLEPADMRLRKPVLVNTQDVLEQSGYEQGESLREFVRTLPESATAQDFARAVGLELVNKIGTMSFTIAEITIPGIGVSIPLTIDLSGLGLAA